MAVQRRSIARFIVFAGLMAVALDVRAEDWATLSNDYLAYQRKDDPLLAGQRGDAEALKRWPDNSPAAVQARRDALEGFKTRIGAIAPATLSEQTALDHAIMARQIDLALDSIAFDEARIPFQARLGFYSLPERQAERTILRTEAAARAWLARLAAIPDYFASETANLRRGISTKFTQPPVVVATATGTLSAVIAAPVDESALLKPFDTLPVTMADDVKASLRREAQTLLTEKVRPAQSKLLAFFTDEYLPKARRDLAITSIKDGARYYAFAVRRHTTTDMTPAEIHRVGLAEVARIRADMEKQMAETGFKGDLKAFLASLVADPRFTAATPEDYFEKTAEIGKRVDYQLPRYFGKLPRLPYGIRPDTNPANKFYGGYERGSPESGTAGAIVYPGSRVGPLYNLPAWTLHEGEPGHHLQIALSQENTNISEFRRGEGVTAFVEGWGLYAELLGEEMGIYRDAYERFGRLSMEMWRACRLVMDTGLHTMKWTRDQATQCLKDNTAMPSGEIYAEVDRYIGYPGQALSYKIGELKIVELRRRAEAALGAKFNIRAFHDMLLGEGALPLNVVERRVDQWIAAQKGASAPA